VPVYQLLGGKIHEEVRIYADSHAGENISSVTPMLEQRIPRWMKPGEGERPPEIYMPEAYAKRAKAVVAKGFDAIKFDLDYIVVPPGDEWHHSLTNAEIEQMGEVSHATREAVGNDIDIAWDCHWRFRPADAIRIAHAIAGSNPFWLEDPCPPKNWRHMQR
jgi:L-alanine-DL-glutamate epimerase-like enolase superfamily enzyme